MGSGLRASGVFLRTLTQDTLPAGGQIKRAPTPRPPQGYHSEATLQQLVDAGVDALIAHTGLQSRDSRFVEVYRHKPPAKRRQPGKRRSKWFVRADLDYNAEEQSCIFPNGKRLKLSTTHAVIKGRRSLSFGGTRKICGACPLKAKCLRKP